MLLLEWGETYKKTDADLKEPKTERIENQVFHLAERQDETAEAAGVRTGQQSQRRDVPEGSRAARKVKHEAKH